MLASSNDPENCLSKMPWWQFIKYPTSFKGYPSTSLRSHVHASALWQLVITADSSIMSTKKLSSTPAAF